MAMKSEPNYYAIIPAPVRYSQNLSGNEKLFYGELSCLTHKCGHCFATNNYFAELYNVSERTIQNWLENLEREGFIKRVSVTADNKTIRKIFVIERFAIKRRMKKTSRGSMKKTSG
jgi:uncharacterized protein YpbB